MKKAFSIGLILFWIITTILLTAAFVSYQQSKPAKKIKPALNNTTTETLTTTAVPTEETTDTVTVEPIVETAQIEDSTAVQREEPYQTFTVSIDKDGSLFPTEINISVGDSVDFVYQNPGDEQELFFSPASQERIKLDHEYASVSRTFNTAGTWLVHTKNNPPQMTIIVQ